MSAREGTRAHVLPSHDTSPAWPITVVRRGPHDHSVPHGAVTHAYATLVFHRGGRSRIEQKGEWRLDAGDVMLVPAGEPHRALENRGSDYWGLGFCVSCFAADAGSTLLEPFERVRSGAAPVLQIPAARRAFFESLFVELARASSRRKEGRVALDAVQRSLLTLILSEVDRAASAPRSPSKRGVVVDALRFIERNCLRPLTLGEVARAVGRTPSHVTSALKHATGQSAVEWIVTGRMAEARRLLLHSDEMVDVIAERVGYADPTHFIRMFRRAHGETPAKWRALNAAEPAPRTASAASSRRARRSRRR